MTRLHRTALIIGTILLVSCGPGYPTVPAVSDDFRAITVARAAWTAAGRWEPVCAPLERVQIAYLSETDIRNRCCLSPGGIPDPQCLPEACSTIQGATGPASHYVFVMLREGHTTTRWQLIVHEALHQIRFCAVFESQSLGLSLDDYTERVRWGLQGGETPPLRMSDPLHQDDELWDRVSGEASIENAAWSIYRR